MENKRKMEPEPAAYFEGKLISDESEYTPMLGNATANAMADQLAVKTAVELGLFTEEEAKALLVDPKNSV